jgi:uncharacterized membrane protein YiaA
MMGRISSLNDSLRVDSIYVFIYSELWISARSNRGNRRFPGHNGRYHGQGGTMKLKRTTARFTMLLGALVYLIGIWRTCPLFSGKGYFLGVLVMGIFAVLTHQRTEQEAQRDDDFISLCRLVLLLAVGLLLVGAWFVPAPWREKGVYVMAWFVCMYGASATFYSAKITEKARSNSVE